MVVTTNRLAAALDMRLLGYDAAAKTLDMEFRPGAEFRQGAGLIQGGAIAAMLDFAMAFAAMTELAEGAGLSTTTMTTTFLRPARAAAYRATGRIERAGRRVIFAAADLHDGAAKVAQATSALLVVPGAGSMESNR